MKCKELCLLSLFIVSAAAISWPGSAEKSASDLEFANAILRDEAAVLEIRSVPLRYLTPAAITPETFSEYSTRRAQLDDFSGSKFRSSLAKVFSEHEFAPTKEISSVQWNLIVRTEFGDTLAELYCDQSGRFMIANGKRYKSDGSLGRLLISNFGGLL